MSKPLLAAAEKDDSENLQKRFEFDQDEFPEGGFGWLVALAGWCIMACTFGMVNSFGVYQTYYETEAYPSETTFKISVIGSLQSFSLYIFALPAVTLLHYFGSRVTVGIGVLIQSFAFMMMSLTTDMWQLFLTQGILLGMGGGFIYLSGVTVLMQWFKKKKAMAMGIVSSGSSLGGVYWPIAVRRLLRDVGYAWTNRILGFIYIPMGVIMVLFLKSRLTLKHPSADVKRNPLMLKFKVLNDSRFLLLIFANLVGMFGLFPGLFYVDLYATKLSAKLGSELVAPEYYLSILNALSLFGRIIPGMLADRFGRLNVLFPFLVLSGVLPLVLWLNSSDSEVVFLIFVIFWGFSSGVYVSLFPTVVPQLFGSADSQSRMSFLFSIGGIGALFGPIICGSFLPQGSSDGDLTGFTRLTIFTGVMLLGSAVLEAILRLSYSRNLTAII